MSRPSRERSTEVAIGALAGVAAVAGSLLATGNTPAFVGAGAAAVVRDTAPGVVAAVVRSLGDLAEPLLVAVTALLLLGTYAGAAVLARQYADDTAPRAAATLALVGGITLLLTASLASALGAGVAAATVVVAATLTVGSEPSSEDTSPARRRLLQAAGATLAALAASAVRLGGSESTAGGPGEPPDPAAQSLLSAAEARSLSLPNADGLVSEGFYTVDIATVAPTLGGDWELTVTGEVPEERSFTLSELQSFEGERRFVTLRCVSDGLNGEKIDTALWDGVPIATLLDEVNAPESCCVTLHAADDYFVSFPREALDPGLLAWGMNGRPLPRAHGAPVRTLVPGHWGETNAKWLTEIEIREEPEDGYWEQRGWEGTGEVHTVAKLHSTTVRDGTVRVGGHAYAGTRGISAVELSTDGGDSWTEATLSDPLPGATPLDADEPEPDGEADDAWRMWEHEYEAEQRHEVVVRAIDGDGNVQPEAEVGAYPSGATGWVSEVITV